MVRGFGLDWIFSTQSISYSAPKLFYRSSNVRHLQLRYRIIPICYNIFIPMLVQPTHLTFLRDINRLLAFSEPLISHKHNLFLVTAILYSLLLDNLSYFNQLIVDVLQLIWSDTVRPVCLPSSEERKFVGMKGTIAGWGYLDEWRDGKSSSP